MKRRMTLLTLLSLMAVSAFSQIELRAWGEMNTDFNEEPSSETISDAWDQESNLKLGLGSEVLFGKVGALIRTSTRFTQVPETTDWTMDFSTNLGVAYHIWGPKGFLDPFAEFGFAAGGGIDLKNGERYDEEDEMSGLALSFSPYVGGGLNLNFDGLLVGARLQYHVTSLPIPVSPIPESHLSRYQFAFTLGFTTGALMEPRDTSTECKEKVVVVQITEKEPEEQETEEKKPEPEPKKNRAQIRLEIETEVPEE